MISWLTCCATVNRSIFHSVTLALSLSVMLCEASSKLQMYELHIRQEAAAATKQLDNIYKKR